MAKNKDKKDEKEMSESERHQKIESLREMISSAERTIQSAKAMLLQFEGKKKLGRKRKADHETDGTVIEGTFDGQIMVGTDGKQYPVPANYASKSKLVEGDMLKLTITPGGSFIYKQIGPAERKNAIGIVSQDESGNYYVVAEGKPYKVLLASVTYFKAEPGDEVAIVLPRNLESSWAAIENILQKGKQTDWGAKQKPTEENLPAEDLADPKAKLPEPSQELPAPEKPKTDSVLDEWTADIDEIEKEVKK